MKFVMKNPFTLIKDKNLKQLHGKKKIQYIWDYYKLPITVLCIFLYIIVYILYRHFSYRNPVIYTALVNVAVGEDLNKKLSTDFLNFLNLSPSKNKVELYTGLYLTDDEQNAYYQYTYASRIKILATIDGELLDVVLMNKEAFDAFSQNGYLCDLDMLLSQKTPDFYNDIKSDLSSNIIILEDNANDLIFDPSISYYAVTEEYYYGLDLSRTNLIQQAGFEEPVYLGIIANSPRQETAITYLQYLYSIK